MIQIDISFILPTNREYSLYSQKVINNINSLNFFGRTHEIVVVSPNEIKGKNVVYVPEPEDSHGCVSAINEGFKKSAGDYIFLCSDDHYFNVDCCNMIDILESQLFKDRKYKVACLPTNNHGPCKLPEYCESGDEIIARFPVYSRETIEVHLDGYVFHPSFKHHYSDNWLGYWLGQQGEPAIEVDKFDMITFNNSCDTIHDEHDEKVFKTLIANFEKTDKRYVSDDF